MTFFFVTHPEPEAPCTDDLHFVRIAGRLIPLTPSALARLTLAGERETTSSPDLPIVIE